MTIGQMLRHERHRRNLTLREVAAHVQVDFGTISNLEIGKTKDPSFALIVRLCRLYGIPITVLSEKV